MTNEQQSLATRSETAVTAPSEALAFLQVIERASRDPSVDVEKMERLMAMHERMTQRQAEAEFNDALVACQQELRIVAADADNPQTRSRYATYATLDRALRPIYTKHGISISYGTEECPKPDCLRIIAHVARKGYTRIYRVDMPADGKGAKGGDVMTKTHAAGAAMSYGARYLLKGIFNISVGEDDDDGNGAGNRRGLSEDSRADFESAIDAVTELPAWERLWSEITAATTKAGDVQGHEQLRTLMAAKRRAILKAAT